MFISGHGFPAIWAKLQGKESVPPSLIHFWYAANSQEIAEFLGTKTESHVRKFFFRYRKSRDLDSICKQSQIAQKSNDGNIETMEVQS